MNMNGTWQDTIESDPLILRGKPCFKGTRIPVALVLGYLAAGAAGRSREEIFREFPDLKPSDIGSALGYARDLADFELAGTP
jgi:uncharacterized protein (DUF433 family)